MALLPYYLDTAVIYTHNNDAYIYGTAFGSELVLNGDFSSGLTNWTPGTGWSHIAVGTDSPYAKATGSITNSSLEQNVATVVDEYYKVEFTLVQSTGSNYQIQFSLGGYEHNWVGSFPGEGLRTYMFYFKATTTGGDLKIKATVGSGSAIGVKDISVKQATATASMISQFSEGEIWPRQGTLESSSGNQSPWWIGD